MATPIPNNRVRFTGHEILQAVGGRLRDGASLDAAFVGVTSDSRRATGHSRSDGHDVFVALIGDTHDGHDYVERAFVGGAKLAMVQEWRDAYAPFADRCVLVDDTLVALGNLARHHRRRLTELTVVGITGSVGKTTTKDLAMAALAGIGEHIVGTLGNLNNRIGVPMTLFTATTAHRFAVVEMGMNTPGEIAELARIAEPDVGIVTRVAAAHTELVPSLAAIAVEKSALLKSISADGTAIWNADDPWIATETRALSAGTTLTFGTSDGANVRRLESAPDEENGFGTRVAFQIQGQSTVLKTSLLGDGAQENLSAVVALMVALGRAEWLSRPALHAALLSKKPAPGRLCPIVTKGNVLLLDDTYNASPQAMLNALQCAFRLAEGRRGRVIAVLGDMLELGQLSESLHREVAVQALATNVALFVAFGPEMRAAADELRARGKEHITIDTDSVEVARDAVIQWARPSDVVVLKGSRGMHMEDIVEALRTHFDAPSSLQAAPSDGGETK